MQTQAPEIKIYPADYRSEVLVIGASIEYWGLGLSEEDSRLAAYLEGLTFRHPAVRRIKMNVSFEGLPDARSIYVVFQLGEGRRSEKAEVLDWGKSVIQQWKDEHAQPAGDRLCDPGIYVSTQG